MKNMKQVVTRPRRKKNYTVFLVDESGSMLSMRKQAMNAFNEQIQSIRRDAKSLDCKVSLITFSELVNDPVYWNEDKDKVSDLTEADYAPNGGTALYDAVGYAIDKLKLEKNINSKNTSVLFVIISDGEENSSKVFNRNDIAERIQECQKTERWTFTYSGSNQDLSKLAKDLNIPIGNMQWYNPTQDSFLRATNMRQCSNTSYYNQVSTQDVGAVRGFYSSVNAQDATTPPDSK